jgi:anti-anti-sigma factor
MTLPDHFSVSSDSSPGVVTVVVTGEVDLDTAPAVHDEVLRHLHPGATVHLDLGDVTFMDSSGLQVLLSSRRHATEVGAELRLVRVSARVQRLIVLTGTRAVLEQSDIPASIPSQATDRSDGGQLAQS